MVVLQVKAREEELLILHPINGPKEAVEGEEIESRKLQKYPFAVRLDSERVVRRVPTSLGNILGLTPKSMR
jgi:hypothetical protein